MAVRRHHWIGSIGLAVLTVLGLACDTGPSLPAGSPSEPIPTTGAAPTATETVPQTETRPEPDSPPDVVDAAITVGGVVGPFDRRLLGTNLPAWIGPERLADAAFQSLTTASGTTLLRMPGGSWSNSYDWRACEIRDEADCFWTWAARPSDFIDFLQATKLEGMWTVSINHTAQSAAAAVAFFNGSSDDQTVIGIDRNGVDWGTVSRWAELRADGGNLTPIGIDLWEIGNEVFGGRPEAGGEQCASFGWEDVWTCDGSEYIDGTADHDGFIDIRRAMLAVDPSIEVGVVGVDIASDWNDWGNEVLDGVGADLDFYVVHDYAYDSSPDPADAVRSPSRRWPTIAANLGEQLDAGITIALTEYNLISFQEGDNDQVMTQAANALYIADTIGQLAHHGVAIANQWNLANGAAENGTDYGMIGVEDGEDFTTSPQYDALAAWSAAGPELLAVDHDEADLGVYPTRHPDGSVTLIIVNRSGEQRMPTISVDGFQNVSTTLVTVSAADLTDTTMATESTFGESNGPVAPVLPPWSISTLSLTAVAGDE